MNSSTLIGIIVALVLVGGGFYYYQNMNTEMPNEDDQEMNDTMDDMSTSTDDDMTETDATTSDDMGDMADATVVTYTASGFSPASVEIAVGDTVRFVNESSNAMWVGSDVHPTHTNYAGTSLQEHCPDTAGTAFDQCSTGETYEFTFEKAGEWKYHNHRRASDGGTIVVTE